MLYDRRRAHNLQSRNAPTRPLKGLALACALLALSATPAAAYIGPGAGFALGGSILVGLAGALVAIGAVLLWPLRTLSIR